MQRLKTIPVWVWSLIVAGTLAALSLLLSEFQLLLGSQMLIAGLFALSLNLIMGYGGMVHFGHAAFYGLGAYALAVLVSRYDVSPWLGLIVAPFFSAAVAVIVGWFCVRRVRLYFSILTLAFGQILYVLVFQVFDTVTGGDNGIHGLAVPELIAGPREYYLFTLLVFGLCFAAMYVLSRAPFVLLLRAIRENAERAQFIGVDVRRHQLGVFVIGSFFAGIAGALMALLNRFVAPEMLFWTTSSEPILGSLMGGMFSLPGPAVGAALLLFLHVWISQYTEFWPTVLGMLTVGVVLLAPSGLLGLGNRWLGAARAEE